MNRHKVNDSQASIKMTQQLLDKYSKELKEFEEWISTKPNLPQSMDKLFLLRFLKVYDFDLEKAKELLLLNFETRKKNPAIFADRDVLSPEMQQAMSTMQFCPMKKTTAENHKISVMRLVDPDPSKYVYLDVCRLFVSMLDVRFITPNENDLINGEIGVMDMSGFGFKHFLKSASSLSVMRAYMKYAQEAVPCKMVQNHFINCSPMMDRFMSLMRPFLKKEVIDTIKFHSSLETLYDTISRELLPNEFGGTAGSYEDLYHEWTKHVESKRDFLLNNDNWALGDEE